MCTHIHMHTHAVLQSMLFKSLPRFDSLCVDSSPFLIYFEKILFHWVEVWIILFKSLNNKNYWIRNKYVKVYVVLHWVCVITSIHPRCVISVWHDHVKHNRSFFNLNKIMKLFNYICNNIKNNVLNTESLPDTLKGNCRRKTMVTPDVLIMLNGHSARITK